MFYESAKMKQIEEIGDFRLSSGLKGVKMKTINVNKLIENPCPSSISFIFRGSNTSKNGGNESESGETINGGDSIL